MILIACSWIKCGFYSINSQILFYKILLNSLISLDPLNAKTFGENQLHYNVKCQPQNKASQMWNPFKASQTSKIDDQTGYPCYEHGVLIIGKDNKLLVT